MKESRRSSFRRLECSPNLVFVVGVSHVREALDSLKPVNFLDESTQLSHDVLGMSFCYSFLSKDRID